jgi:hypothetical protein
MLVSLNGILQAPTSSFSVSGATLTFVSNLATGDVIDFVMLLGNVLDIGTPSDGTISNAKLGTDVISGETDIGGAIADADLFLLDDGAGGTLRKTAASRIATYIGAGTNTPAFMAYLSSAQSISDATWTKIQFDTEVLDTDNAYDNSSNYRFTPQTAGKYLVNCYTVPNTGTNTDILRHYQSIYKNGSQAQLYNLDTRDGGGFRVPGISSSYIINMNGSSDYIEIFVYADSNSGNNANIAGGSDEHSFFSAHKIIE